MRHLAKIEKTIIHVVDNEDRIKFGFTSFLLKCGYSIEDIETLWQKSQQEKEINRLIACKSYLLGEKTQ